MQKQLDELNQDHTVPEKLRDSDWFELKAHISDGSSNRLKIYWAYVDNNSNKILLVRYKKDNKQQNLFIEKNA